MESDKIDSSNHIYDGIDPDSPDARPPERRQVSCRARQLVADYGELAGMSESDKRRYCGGA